SRRVSAIKVHLSLIAGDSGKMVEYWLGASARQLAICNGEISEMKIRKVEKNGIICAVIDSEDKVITDSQSALDLLMTAKYDAETKNIVINKKMIAEDFFILSTGLAGEILQKYINYGGRVAIYGDFSHYTSKPLKDFIYESNKGKDVFFVATEDEAIEKLSR
ncbi:MAG: DUF4180 domain-containing protein, partial [Acidaminococcaceae bacterium]|nr:DUF4180 domain-containing protein [Acidaminococcaceae bacterium]